MSATVQDATARTVRFRAVPDNNLHRVLPTTAAHPRPAGATEEGAHEPPTPAAGLLLYSLAFGCAVSFVFVLSELIAEKSVSPLPVAVFLLTAGYSVLLGTRRAVVTEEEVAVQVSSGRLQGSAIVIEKDERHALLHYFIYHRSASAADGAGEKPPQREGDTGEGEKGRRGGTGGKKNPSLSTLPASLTTPSPPAAASICTDDVDLEAGLDPLSTTTTASPDGSSPPPTAGENGRIKGTLDAVAQQLDAVRKLVAARGDEEAQGGCSKRAESSQWSGAEACIICFCEYTEGEQLCQLPCRHVYHAKCIDEWLDGANHGWCPLCRRDIIDCRDNATGDAGGPTVIWAPTNGIEAG